VTCPERHVVLGYCWSAAEVSTEKLHFLVDSFVKDYKTLESGFVLYKQCLVKRVVICEYTRWPKIGTSFVRFNFIKY